MPFFIFMILAPVAELYVFGVVSARIGAGNALLLMIAGAMAGVFILRHQGMHTLRAAQDAMRVGQVPLNEMFEGLCLAAAGVALIVPGFISDTIGLLLLAPAVRGGVRRYIAARTTGAGGADSPRPYESPRSDDRGAIDVEFERLDDDTRDD